jgi:hypothetical protein
MGTAGQTKKKKKRKEKKRKESDGFRSVSPPRLDAKGEH